MYDSSQYLWFLWHHGCRSRVRDTTGTPKVTSPPSSVIKITLIHDTSSSHDFPKITLVHDTSSSYNFSH